MSNGNDFGNAFGQQSNGNGKINEDIIANSGENSIEAFAVAAAVAATVSPPPNRRRYNMLLCYTRFFPVWRVACNNNCSVSRNSFLLTRLADKMHAFIETQKMPL